MRSDTDLKDQFDEEKINVYLAGPLSDYDDHQKTHETVKDRTVDVGLHSRINWVDPLALEPEFANGWEMIWKDLEVVEEVDVVFAYRPGGCESWGTKHELHHAIDSQTPIVIWDMDGSDHNHWLHLPFVVEKQLGVALDAIVALDKIHS